MPGCSLVGGVPRTVAADDETFGHSGHPPGDKTSMTESSTMPAWCASARRGLATYFPGQESNTPPGLPGRQPFAEQVAHPLSRSETPYPRLSERRPTVMQFRDGQ